jgi:hypothetical protein
MAKFEFQDGCMWEEDEWEIVTDCECSGLDDDALCRHCHSEQKTEHGAGVLKAWICPAVVVAYNEGGHCSTGVCLHCILEAAEKALGVKIEVKEGHNG